MTKSSDSRSGRSKTTLKKDSSLSSTGKPSKDGSSKHEKISRAIKKSPATQTAVTSAKRRSSETRNKIFSSLVEKFSKNAHSEEEENTRGGENIPDYAANSTILQYLSSSGARPTRPPVNPITIDLQAPKEVLSHAQKRKLKQPVVVITKEMREAFKEERKELRKVKRMLKSNGSRRKYAKYCAKRGREEDENEEAVQALDPDFAPRSRGRRLE